MLPLKNVCNANKLYNSEFFQKIVLNTDDTIVEVFLSPP